MARLLARTTSLGSVALALLAVVIALPFATSAQSRQLRLVSTTWPPFTGPAGQPRYALDLVEAALGKADITAISLFVDAGAYTRSLLGPAYDGSAAAWKDPQREKLLLFSEPYLENRLVLVGRRGADVSATTLAAMKGKRIAVVDGYSYGGDVERAGPAFVRTAGEEDSLRQLLASKVDYALMDELVVNYLIENHAEQAEARLQLGTTPLVTRPLYLAVSRSRPDAQAIISRFNGQLRGMIADRTYHRLLHVEWIKADVDGDGVAEFVPQSDQVGTSEPQRAYAVLSSSAGSGLAIPGSTPPAPTTEKPGFYVGGNIYRDWASVPESYRVVNPQWKDPDRASASIFRFTW
jgi:polar amino acid transport system substrate-binding protein